jgi:3-oxoacyl-[acyl-carrier protein] reductase
MMGKRSGSIINLSSVAAQHSNKGQSNYAASKAGIEALTRTMAAELAGRKIRVNAIAPGFIETEMTQTVRQVAGDKIKGAIPMKRYGSPEDIAGAAVFLASPDSSYITGQVLTVDGGLSLGGSA